MDRWPDTDNENQELDALFIHRDDEGQVLGGPLAALLERGERGDELALLGMATRIITALFDGEGGWCVLLDGQPRIAVAVTEPDGAIYGSDAHCDETVPRLPRGYPGANRPTRKMPVASSRTQPGLVQHPILLEAVAQREIALGSECGAGAGATPRYNLAVVPLVTGDVTVGAVVVRSALASLAGVAELATARMVGRLAAHLVRERRLREWLAGYESAPKEPHRPSRHRALGSESRRAARPARTLIVEDDSSHAAILSAVLERHGYQVDVAADGSEGLERAAANLPDLILLDVVMPHVDGFKMAEQLRRDPKLRDIPILFVSACDDASTRAKGLQMGAADFLCKPFYAPELLARIERALNQADMREQLRAEAQLDELTGLGNLRYLRERLELEESRAQRYGMPLSVVMIDLDKFKQINDRFGHAAGDEALQQVARVLRSETRDTDIAARYGGDEFVVVLPHANLEAATRFAERVAARIGEIRAFGVPMSASLGVAARDAHDAPSRARAGAGRRPPASLHGAPQEEDTEATSPLMLSHVLAQADDAAYRAKRQGGNRVEVYVPNPPGDPLATPPATSAVVADPPEAPSCAESPADHAAAGQEESVPPMALGRVSTQELRVLS